VTRVPASAQIARHAAERALHDEAHVEQRADAEEYQASDQAVREAERIDRLQPIDLQHVHQGGRLAFQRIEKQRSHSAAFEEQHTRVHGGHSEPHREHQQRFEHALPTEVDQKKSQQDQEDPTEHDSRFGGREGSDALKKV
jgi:hypothetical protein